MNLLDYKTEINEHKEVLGPVIHIPDKKAYDVVRQHLDMSIDREVQKHLFKHVVGLTRIRELSLKDALKYNKALKNVTEMEATDFICKAEFRHRDLVLKKLRKPGDDVENIPQKPSLVNEVKANFREVIELKLRKKEVDDKIHQTKQRKINDLFNLRSQKHPIGNRVFQPPSKLIQEMPYEEFKRKRYKILKSGNMSFCQNKDMVSRNNRYEATSKGNKINKGPITILPDTWFTMRDEVNSKGRRDAKKPEAKGNQAEKHIQKEGESKRIGLTDLQLMDQLIKFAEEKQKGGDQMSELTEISSDLSQNEEEDLIENKTFMESLKVISKNRTGSIVARERFSILQAKELSEIYRRNSVSPNKQTHVRSATEPSAVGNERETNDDNKNNDDEASVVFKPERKNGRISIDPIKEGDSSGSSSSSLNKSQQKNSSSKAGFDPAESMPDRDSVTNNIKEPADKTHPSPQQYFNKPQTKNGSLKEVPDKISRRALTEYSTSQVTEESSDILRKSSEGVAGRRMTKIRRKMLLNDKSEDSGDYTQEDEPKKPAILVYSDNQAIPSIVSSKTPTFKGKMIDRNKAKGSSGIPYSYFSGKDTSPERPSGSILRYSNQSREAMRKKLLENRKKLLGEFRLERSFDDTQRRSKTQVSDSVNKSLSKGQPLKRPATNDARQTSPLDRSFDQLYQRLDNLQMESKEGLEALNFEKWKADFRHKNQQETMSMLTELSETKGKALELMYLYNKSNQIHEKYEGQEVAKQIQNRSVRIERIISMTHRKGILEDLKKIRKQKALFRNQL